jgi:MraZ protein
MAGKSVQHVFVGVYERQLDERGRVALPTAFRSSIGEQCYLTYGEDGCVRIMSEDNFNLEVQEMNDSVKAGETSRSRLRAFASSVVVAGLDKQGRIVVDPRLRSHAGIEPQAPIMVLGLFDRIEIWEPSRYEAEETLGKNEIAGDGGGTR